MNNARQPPPASKRGALLALLLCVFLSARDGKARAWETPSAASPALVRSLIVQLGDASFAAREEATTRLSRMDVSVRGPLQQAANSRDAEVRSRARRILAVVNERYFEQRLSAFSADVDGAQGLELPGWPRFREIVGGDRKARDFFVELQRAEPRLFESAESRPGSLNEAIADRLRDAFQSPEFGGSGDLSASSTAAVVFLASDSHLKLSPDVASLVSMLPYRPAFEMSLTGARRDPLKKLLDTWVIRETDDVGLLRQNVALAQRHDLSVGRDLATRLLKRADLPPLNVVGVMSLLARSGKPQDAALLERFLSDESVLATRTRNGRNGEVLKLCDCAMAMMIALTGEKADQYLEGPVRWNQGWNADPDTLAFSSDEARQVALARWKAWWAQNKDKLGDLPRESKD